MSDPTTARPYYVTTAIPYVNAQPHIGFAMELVQADVLARYQRQRGRDVRFSTGTDENSLKNVRAAEAEGITTAELVQRNAAAFWALRDPLGVSFDDFIRTSTDPRHRAGAQRLWQACAQRGDIYRRSYRGQYCVGCEQFYSSEELSDGRCPEHGVVPETVEEDNYFFRLSRYEDELIQRLESGALRVVPEGYRSEMLAFCRRGLEDLSISRSSQRARGWGISVPGDPDQVMYVWFDALGNYISALGYADEAEPYRHYWLGSGDRVHVLGKGITRFHAIYWPAMLLSAGLSLPTAIVVHGYLTAEGVKIGKSGGNAADPAVLTAEFGTDALRYFLCRHVRAGKDGDFSRERVEAVVESELADQLGNLLSRTVGMIERYYGGRVPASVHTDGSWPTNCARVRQRVDRAFADFRHDEALDAAWSLVTRANKVVVEQAPWRLAKQRGQPEVEACLATTLYELAEVLRLIAYHLRPFMPATATAIERQLGLHTDALRRDVPVDAWGALQPGAVVSRGDPLFPKRDAGPRSG